MRAPSSLLSPPRLDRIHSYRSSARHPKRGTVQINLLKASVEKWERRALAKGPRERAVLKKLATTPKGRIRRLNSCAGSKFRERSSRKEGRRMEEKMSATRMIRRTVQRSSPLPFFFASELGCSGDRLSRLPARNDAISAPWK